MIKVNLLDSVTDRSRSVAQVERRVTNPRTRTLMLLGSVSAVMLLGGAVDYVSAGYSLGAAQQELERQKQIAAQTAAINKEQADLEKKLKDVQARIDVIKKLRAAQQGPVGVLNALNARLPASADVRLETVEQKAGELTIEGFSPNEDAVTRFARSLEFSDGLFANVSIETERAMMEPANVEVKVEGAPPDPANPMAGIDMKSLPRLDAVKFKIKCKYTQGGADVKPPAAPGAPQPPATQVAQK